MSHTIKRRVTVYKRAYTRKNKRKNVIVVLELRRGTQTRKPVSTTLAKNRANKAYVKRIESPDGKQRYRRAYTDPMLGVPMWYRVGKVVKPHAWDESVEMCRPGIHFFRDRDAAEGYC